MVTQDRSEKRVEGTVGLMILGTAVYWMMLTYWYQTNLATTTHINAQSFSEIDHLHAITGCHNSNKNCQYTLTSRGFIVE